jgi:hypothetical protein
MAAQCAAPLAKARRRRLEFSLVVWRSDPPFPRSHPVKFSPFPVLLAALAIGTVWAGNDAAARFNRCTEMQSLAHCRLVFYGR